MLTNYQNENMVGIFIKKTNGNKLNSWFAFILVMDAFFVDIACPQNSYKSIWYTNDVNEFGII